MIIKKINTFLRKKKLAFIILESDDGSFSHIFSLVPLHVYKSEMICTYSNQPEQDVKWALWLVRMTVNEQVKWEGGERFRLIGSLLNCGLQWILLQFCSSATTVLFK